MRKFTPLAAMLFTLPLAACFDAEMTVNFIDANTVEATIIRTASASFFEVPTAAADFFCEDGVEALGEDGSRTCTSSYAGTIDEVVNDPDIGEAVSIMRRDGGLVFASVDLGVITADIAPPDDAAGGQMLAMMAAELEGHAITLLVTGDEIIETNGTISADGKTAHFFIPLDGILTGEFRLPPSFDVLLRPGT